MTVSRAIRWTGNALELLDQRVLPLEQSTVEVRDVRGAAAAIRDMVVRGAPAIGVTAAYGVVLAAGARYRSNSDTWREALQPDLALLAASRPTAVNLSWALRRMQTLAATLEDDPVPDLLAEALRIHAEDIAANRTMGRLGAELIDQPCDVLTHCNAGSLATGGYGTALGVVRSAFQAGKIRHVFADETRPWLQGARLTAWELRQDDIPVSLIADSAASYALHRGTIGWVIVGADRVAANGDVANKIGTYALAVSCRYHGVGFMVVAPVSTIDLDCPDGTGIPIENRAEDEILSFANRRIAAPGVTAWNPVFDVTPAELVDVLVTERGVVHRPDTARISALLEAP